MWIVWFVIPVLSLSILATPEGDEIKTSPQDVMHEMPLLQTPDHRPDVGRFFMCDLPQNANAYCSVPMLKCPGDEAGPSS